jgi:ribosome-associated toxin RatA of RatAB toxin-antitoxin module
VIESAREFDRVNDLQQYHDRLLIYAESDVYTVSKAELIAQSTTAIRSVTSDTATAPTYDLQGRQVEVPRSGIFIKNGRKVVR